MARKWGASPDGRYEIISLSKGKLPDAMDVMRQGFFGEETVSVACELPNNTTAIAELEDMVVRAMQDGVSLIAVEIATRKVVAASINIFEYPDESSYYTNYQNNCKTANAKYLLQFMIDLANEFDIFKQYKVDCLIEIMFLATLKEHRGHGLAKVLFECTIAMAKKLQNGQDVRTLVDNELKPLTQPQLVTALCSSFITQKITKQLGFENVKMISFNRWSFKGKSFADVIGPHTPATSIDCFVL